MNRYTIYCTPEQTRKAMELGAPIKLTRDSEGLYFNYSIPTAEEMIGWLEEQGEIDCIEMSKSNIVNEGDKWQYSIWDREGYWDWGAHGFDSRIEATIAAIDKALEYLSEKEK